MTPGGRVPADTWWREGSIVLSAWATSLRWSTPPDRLQDLAGKPRLRGGATGCHPAHRLPPIILKEFLSVCVWFGLVWFWQMNELSGLDGVHRGDDMFSELLLLHQEARPHYSIPIPRPFLLWPTLICS